MNTEKKVPNKYDLIREKQKVKAENQAKQKQKADDFFSQKSNKQKDQQEK